MFLTVHAAAGAAIGSFVPNPPLTFMLGILSHFLLDRVPHYDPPIIPGTAKDGVLRHPVFRRFLVIAATDAALASLLVAWVLSRLPQFSAAAIIGGAFGGVVPDLLFGLYRLTNNRWLRIYNRFHQAIHFDQQKIRVTFFSGMATQLVTLGLCLGLLFR